MRDEQGKIKMDQDMNAKLNQSLALGIDLKHWALRKGIKLVKSVTQKNYYMTAQGSFTNGPNPLSYKSKNARGLQYLQFLKCDILVSCFHTLPMQFPLLETARKAFSFQDPVHMLSFL